MQKTATTNPITAADEAEHLAEYLAQAEEDKARAIQDRLIDVIQAGVHCG